MDNHLKSRLNACFENVLSEWNQELSPDASGQSASGQSTSGSTSVIFTSVLLFLCGLCVGALVTFYWLEDPENGNTKEDD